MDLLVLYSMGSKAKKNSIDSIICSRMLEEKNVLFWFMFVWFQIQNLMNEIC